MTVKQAAAAANVAASTAIAQPAPNRPTSSPARLNPRIIAVFCDSRSTDIAVGSAAAGTVCGTTAREAGPAIAASPPLTALITASIGTLAAPVARLTATIAWERHASAAAPRISIARGSRSPRTPANRVVTTSTSA